MSSVSYIKPLRLKKVSSVLDSDLEFYLIFCNKFKVVELFFVIKKMKLLKCLVFLGFFEVVFGGGLSTCGQLTTDFVELLQICELKVERFLKFLTCECSRFL